MSELKPCPFCGAKAEIERIGTARQSTIYRCTICGCSLETGEEFNHGAGWNQRDDTPDLLRGARIGLEMAAKWHDSQSAEWREYARRAELECDEAEEDEDADEADLRASACREHAGQHLNDALKLRAIPDTDIMKEISREN